jgi:hypothetical protein
VLLADAAAARSGVGVARQHSAAQQERAPGSGASSPPVQSLTSWRKEATNANEQVEWSVFVVHGLDAFQECRQRA